MSADPAPYLSVVIPSRNDQPSGSRRDRTRACVNGFLAQVKRHGLKAELILVEWNPPPDQPPLAEMFDWPADPSCAIRMITAPPELHRRFPHSSEVVFHGQAAWSVGIRRARGRFVLTMTTDLLFSDDLVRFLASERLDPDAFYRIDRTDVNRDVARLPTLEQQLAYCERNTIGVQGATPHEFPASLRIPNLHTGAPGDFMLMSKEAWARVRGYPEFDIVGVGVDVLLCYLADRRGLREVVLKPPMRIFHIDHDSNWSRDLHPLERVVYRGWDLRRFAPRSVRRRLARVFHRLFPRARSRWDRLGIPYLTFDDLERIIVNLYRGRPSFPENGDDWGFAGEKLPERSPLPPSDARGRP
jgi:hypothetical protein